MNLRAAGLVSLVVSRILQDLKYGIRSFIKAPGFTAVAVLVMALGIGANTSIFTIANELMFRPLSGAADDLAGVYSHDRTTPDSYRAFSYPNFVDVRETAGIFDGLMAHTYAMVGTPARPGCSGSCWTGLGSAGESSSV